jgi:hypothetical protein
VIAYLEARNHRLLQLAEHLDNIVREANVPPELEPFKRFVVDQCNELSKNIRRNLQLLHLRGKLGSLFATGTRKDDFLKEILGETKNANLWLQRLSDYYAPPILRSHPHDRLSLSIIGWLHRSHHHSEMYPPVVNSGAVAIHPLGVPPVYYFPVVEQRGLLHQPLLIHEYGHFLYKIHRQEMDDLVAELQEDVLHLLQSSRFRNDLYNQEQAQTRREIAYTWYAWTQEFFCDAVGLTMGGPSYLHAFSIYLHTLQESDFRREPDLLRGSLHPPRWLRIKFLARRANSLGLTKTADEIIAEWEDVHDLLEITEDYYGYYSPDLDEAIEETLSDMLTEIDPRQFTDREVSADQWNPNTDNPIQLLNWAWRVYRDNPSGYPAWERNIIEGFYYPRTIPVDHYD